MFDKEDNLIKVALDEGHEIYFDICESHPQLDENDHRREVILFAIMTCCIGHLHANGWSEKALVNEVFDHCQMTRDLFDDE